MSGAEALGIEGVIGAVTNLLTNGFNPFLLITRTALRCEAECRKLEVVIKSIEEDMQHIKGQLVELERYDPSSRHDLKIVDGSVKKLGKELHLADIELYECSTASRIGKRLGDYRMSKKITAHHLKLTELGKELVQVNLHLTRMLIDARSKNPSMELQQSPHHFNQHDPSQQHRSNTTLSPYMTHSESAQVRIQDPFVSHLLLPYPQFHGGYRSEDSSGHGGGDSPGAILLRQMNQEKEAIFQREEQHRRQAESESQFMRRHTIASAYGHDPLPAYDKWKY